MEPSQRASRPTTHYGRYEVLFRIAAGGMAEVYVARLMGEGGFEKLVALKRMLPTLAEDEKFVGMFLDEGRVAANISSPHVVSTLDMGRAEDDSLYLVMELVVGVSLSALLRVTSRANEYVPLELAVELLAQAATGLEDAHEARTIYGEPLGIVHRDISPQNVLIDVSGRVRITDFGVARALERVTQTQSGEVKGKLAYFAPEQARAKPLDRRADVYALGIVGWELLTGRRLFAGEGPADTLMKVLEMPAPRISDVRPDVPSALADAIAHALTRDIDARTPSAAQFAAELRAAVPGTRPAPLGRFVREHGGESLLRLEEGIRQLVPSTPSANLGSRSFPPGEEPTTRTPSVSRVLEVRSVEAATGEGPVPLAGLAAPVPLAAPSPARPVSRLALVLGGGLLVLGGAVGAGLALQSGATAVPPAADTTVLGASAPESEATPAEPEEVTAESEPVVAAEIAGEPDEVAEALEEDVVVDDTPRSSGRRRPRAPTGGTSAAAETTVPVRTEMPRGSSSTGAATPATTRSTAPGAAGLRGMDDFDSELSGP